MDLGIKGKTAIVCASSKGLGRGCAEALAEAGVNLVMNARTKSTLDETAAKIRDQYGVTVETIATDITADSGRAEVKAAADAMGGADILVNNAGGPPPGMWSDWGREEWQAAIDANMLTPILLTTEILPGMLEKGWGRVVSITSASVRTPIGVLGLSNGARAGFTGFFAGTSRQVAGKGVIMNNILPGIHQTDRITQLDTAAMNASGITMDEARAQRMATIPAGRYGTPEEFGATCAFLCSQHAGFIVGQNILLDGGAFNSSF
ncbi:SDR family oxidoreductase [Rhodovulum sp. DZ06]|uniref:SDR family oxidoreductase n=1 Tax=Rhodovulum sp. DZ06 TaxID=3425126 RepID=UPI003D348C7E